MLTTFYLSWVNVKRMPSECLHNSICSPNIIILHPVQKRKKEKLITIPLLAMRTFPILRLPVRPLVLPTVPGMIPPVTQIPSAAVLISLREGRQRPTLMCFRMTFQTVTRSQQPRQVEQTAMTFETVTRRQQPILNVQQPRQVEQTAMTLQTVTRRQQPSLNVVDVRKEGASQPNFPSLTVRVLHSTFPAFLTIPLTVYIV
jgi:hypothetical protein